MNTSIHNSNMNTAHHGATHEEDPYSFLDDVDTSQNNNHKEIIGNEGLDVLLRMKGKLERLKAESLKKIPDAEARKKAEAGYKKINEKIDAKEAEILKRFVEQEEFVNRIQKQLAEAAAPEMLGHFFLQTQHKQIVPYFIQAREYIDNAMAKYDEKVYSSDGFPTKKQIKKGAPPVLPISMVAGMGQKKYEALKKAQAHWEKVTLGLKLDLVKHINMDSRATVAVLGTSMSLANQGMSAAFGGLSSGGSSFRSAPVSGGFGSAPYTGYQAMG